MPYIYTSIKGEDQIIRYTCILFSHFAPKKKNDSFLHIKAKYLKNLFFLCVL